jgi:thiamine biosynthesis lipoprotein
MRLVFNKIILFLLVFIVFGCNSKSNTKKLVEFKGKTMGSGYSLSYHDSLNRNFQIQIDSLLAVFDKEISTYRQDSRLMLFNQSDSGIFIPSDAPQHLLRNFKLSSQIYAYTAGYFNPAVYPLVDYWGFGKNKKAVENPDSSVIDSLKKICDYNAISILESSEGAWIKKSNPKLQIVFNAIAPGDAADEIGRFLESKGISNYMIEIGGEVRCRGYQSKNFGWMIGINTPVEGVAVNDIKEIVEIKDLSLATSGNYRNFIEVKGKKYAHTINPFTGYPEKNNLLSASIFTKDCAMADGIATACMAMGTEKAWSLVNSIPGTEAYFIYSDEKGDMKVKYTKALEKMIRK